MKVKPIPDCIFWWKGVELRVRLSQSGSISFSKGEGLRVWNLIEISKPNEFFEKEELIPVLKEELIPVLKEALIAYGYSGVRKKIPNLEVRFEF